MQVHKTKTCAHTLLFLESSCVESVYSERRLCSVIINQLFSCYITCEPPVLSNNSVKVCIPVRVMYYLGTD